MSRFHEEFFGKTESRHDNLVMKCVSRDGINKILRAVGLDGETPDFDTDYETEVICQSHGYKSNFIIGYADILVKMVSKLDKSVSSEADDRIKMLVENYHVPEAEAKRSVRNYYHKQLEGTAKVLVECKPDLKDIGTTIRQIKTYESALKDDCVDWFKVIATYSAVPIETIAYLLHENIHVVIFEDA